MKEPFLKSFRLPSEDDEFKFLLSQKRTCYSGVYPFKIMPQKGIRDIRFAPVTFFCGGNGSGKSTLLNVIAEKLGALRHSAFNGSAFFKNYVAACDLKTGETPKSTQILTSDDVFDYMLNVRYLNDGIDVRREELFEDWVSRKYSEHRFTGLDEYDDFKDSLDAKRKTQSQYVRERLTRNVSMFSNGESAMKYFVDHITEDSLYLLDEPENSLSVSLQKDLAQYIADSARYYRCQFVIASHSPVLLSIPKALIYDLDVSPVATRKWTELSNVKLLFDFFEEHREEFEKGN